MKVMYKNNQYPQTESFYQHESPPNIHNIEKGPNENKKEINQIKAEAKIKQSVNKAKKIEKNYQITKVKGRCYLCGKEEDYSNMFKCTMNSLSLSYDIKKIIGSSKEMWIFNDSNIAKIDAMAILSLVKVNTIIECLDFSYNKSVDDEVGQMLMESLKNHPSLKEFYAYHTRISGRIQEKIALTSNEIPHLQQFGLDFICISSKTASILVHERGFELRVGEYNEEGEFITSQQNSGNEQNKIIIFQKVSK